MTVHCKSDGKPRRCRTAITTRHTECDVAEQPGVAAPPPQEMVPRWRRIAEGMRHSKTRDAGAIQSQYDVSDTFYEWVLGPSMTYRFIVVGGGLAGLSSGLLASSGALELHGRV